MQNWRSEWANEKVESEWKLFSSVERASYTHLHAHFKIVPMLNDSIFATSLNKINAGYSILLSDKKM